MPEQCLHGKKFSIKTLRAKSENVQTDANDFWNIITDIFRKTTQTRIRACPCSRKIRLQGQKVTCEKRIPVNKELQSYAVPQTIHKVII
jgi:hypothetical protein